MYNAQELGFPCVCIWAVGWMIPGLLFSLWAFEMFVDAFFLSKQHFPPKRPPLVSGST